MATGQSPKQQFQSNEKMQLLAIVKLDNEFESYLKIETWRQLKNYLDIIF